MDLIRFIEHFNKQDSFSKYNNIKLTKMELGYAEAEIEIKEDSFNFMGSLHGGAIFTLGDVVAGTSIVSYGYNCVTLNCNINFIRPVFKGKVIAKANVVHKGKQTGITEMTIVDEDNKLICRGTYTMFIMDNAVEF